MSEKSFENWDNLTEDEHVAILEVEILREWANDQCKRGIHLANKDKNTCDACGIPIDHNIPVSFKDGQPLYRPNQNDAVN